VKYKYLFAYIVLVIIVVITSYSLAKITHKKFPQVKPATPPTSTPTQVQTKDSYTIALVGYGGGNHDGGGLADSIILLNVNTSSKKANFISIPRDTFISNQKINSIYATQGADGLKTAAKTITGIDTNYIAAINFANFEKAIDALGGVDVEVPVSFEDQFYPIKGLENETCGKTPEEIEKLHAEYSGYQLEQQFTCRYEDLKFEQGVQHMDGPTALKFVRSRHSPQHGGDFARSLRQHALLMGIKDKLISLKALSDIPNFFSQFEGLLATDIDTQVLTSLYALIGDPNYYSINRINLSTENTLVESKTSGGSYILIPKAGEGNWGPVQDFIRNSLK
jgi:anionic cell wall polymer biosynthesis LytR-Cps2A-Psr (LCP) family protein